MLGLSSLAAHNHRFRSRILGVTIEGTLRPAMQHVSEMGFCHSDACQFCPLADQPNMARCRRQWGLFCMKLSETQTPELRAALEELSFLLMDEAAAFEREHAIPLGTA